MKKPTRNYHIETANMLQPCLMVSIFSQAKAGSSLLFSSSSPEHHCVHFATSCPLMVYSLVPSYPPRLSTNSKHRFLVVILYLQSVQLNRACINHLINQSISVVTVHLSFSDLTIANYLTTNIQAHKS